MSFDLLLPVAKSRSKPKTGDIFVLQPKQSCYCYGKVVNNNVISKNVFLNGMILIFIYDRFSETKLRPGFIEKNKIIDVEIVNNRLWSKGYAEIIGNSAAGDGNADYGFFDMLTNEYVDIDGNILSYRPEICGIYGLGSYMSVGKKIHEHLNSV